MRIITVTLNPAYDIHAKTISFKEGEETLADITSYDIGGKGINISKALKAMDILTENIIVLGSENKEYYLNKMREEGLRFKEIYSRGRIRENITIHDEKGVETRLSFKGFKVDDNVLKELKEIIGTVDQSTIICLSGSNPLGINKEELINYLIFLKDEGAKIIIDSKSFSLGELLSVKPLLIKPNEEELMTFCGLKKVNGEIIKKTGLELLDRGIENVLVSLGEKGAILCTKNGVYSGKVPKISVISTVGAGDSSVAGFIYSYIKNEGEKELLINALSFGTAKCLNKGTCPPKKEDILSIKNKITVDVI